MSRLIFGCGYLGSRVAKMWREQGDAVFVVTRSPQRARALAAQGYSPIVANVLQPPTLGDLPAVDTVLWAVGHDRGSGATLREVFVDGLAAVLDALADETGKFIYVSSTGVYGQSGGQRVDEDSTCEPAREAGRACLEAERLLAAHRLGRRAITLRMAGLYGPGRIPNAETIRAGRPITALPSGTLNLIHVDDAASIVLAAAKHAAPPRTYVVSDGHPLKRREYYDELARLLGASGVQFAPPSGDAPVAARAAADKRIDNTRMKTELGVELAYPTYREGLAAIVAAETTRPAGSY